MRKIQASRDLLADAAQDLRVATRRTRRSPALAIAITLTLGLGLGAAAAIFTTFDAALVNPLPYTDAEQLVTLAESRAGTQERSTTSLATLADLRERARSFSALEGYDQSNLTVGVGDDARMLRGAQLTAGFFRLLGVRVAEGRDFSPGEDATSGGAVAIVSHRFARTLTNRQALNRTISLNGTPYVVVGVLPASFHLALLQDADIFIPLIADVARRTDRSVRSIMVVGRLIDDVPLARARAELGGIMTQLAAEHPEELSGRVAVATPLRDSLLGNLKPILTSLLIAVILLLGIMASNLAMLMLARYLERAPELAVRTALGASRARVLRQLFVESLTPSVAGAILATIVGQVLSRAVIGTIPDNVRIDMPYLANVALDGGVIAVIAGVSILLAIAFAVGPALFMRDTSFRAGEARTTVGRGVRRLRQSLVVAQLALTVVLLVSSGLLVASFSNLVNRNVGFRSPETLVSLRAPLSGPRYQDAAVQQQFFESVLARLTAVPGFEAALVDEAPFGGSGSTTFEPLDRPRPRSLQPMAALRRIGGEYFEIMGIPVIAGRAFDSRDRAGTPPVAVVSASFATVLNEDGATMGRRVRLSQTDDTEWEVVGVVGDVQVAPLDVDAPPVIYLSHLQSAENRPAIVVRTTMGAAAVANQVRPIVKSMDPGIPVYGAETLADKLGQSRAVFSRRLPMLLCGVFATAALALTLVALYAMCMHEVQSRRREFGIRLALGGSPGAIRRLILSDGVLLGITGVLLGGFVAVLVSRSMQALLFGITPVDWRVYGAVAATTLTCALLATFGPALRAGSVNPNVVLRQE